MFQNFLLGEWTEIKISPEKICSWMILSRNVLHPITKKRIAFQNDQITDEMEELLKKHKIQIYVFDNSPKGINSDLGLEDTTLLISETLWKVDIAIWKYSNKITRESVSIILTKGISSVIRTRWQQEFISNNLSVKLIEKIISRLFEESIVNPTIFFLLTKHKGRFEHSIESMIRTIDIWKYYWFNDDIIATIAIWSLLHDSWMSFFGNLISESNPILSLRTKTLIQTHTILWFTILSKWQQDITSSSLIAGLHHEGMSFQEGYWIKSMFWNFVEKKIEVKEILRQWVCIIWATEKFSALRSTNSHRQWKTTFESFLNLFHDANLWKLDWEIANII